MCKPRLTIGCNSAERLGSRALDGHVPITQSSLEGWHIARVVDRAEIEGSGTSHLPCVVVKGGLHSLRYGWRRDRLDGIGGHRPHSPVGIIEQHNETAKCARVTRDTERPRR